MPISPLSPEQPPTPSASEIMQAEVARIKKFFGLDVNRLAIGDRIDGLLTTETVPWGPIDLTIKGVSIISFVNVSTSIVTGTQTGT